MARSLLICAGNDYLRDYAARYAKQVEIVPTVVDVQHYQPAVGEAATPNTVIGWMGSPSTWRYVEPLLPQFRALQARMPAVELHAVGAQSQAELKDGVQFIPWVEAEEVAQIQAMAIGIMPVPDEPWARGKCGYKLIQYMACGLPVVASPVGVNAQIVEHGINGFLASTEDEWQQALTQLLEDAALRQTMGNAGREKIRQHYSLQTHGPRLAELIRQHVPAKSGG